MPSGLCQHSQVVKGACVISCGQWKHLATSHAGPSQSRCSLGAGVLGQIMCKLNPDLLVRPWCLMQCAWPDQACTGLSAYIFIVFFSGLKWSEVVYIHKALV